MNTQISDHVGSNGTLIAWNHAGHTPGTTANAYSAPWHEPKALDLILPAPVLVGLSSAAAANLQSEPYEELLLGFLSEMTNPPSTEAETKIDSALKRVCEFFGLEWAAVWRKSSEDPASLLPTHYFPGRNGRKEQLRTATNGLHDPEPQTAAAVPKPGAVSSWITTELQRRKMTLFCHLENLPPEAAQDKAFLQSLGIRSALFIPFSADGEFLGALSFGMTSGKRCWPQSLIKRFEVLAGILGQTSARKRCEERLRLSQAQLRDAQIELKQLRDRLRANNDLLEPVLKRTEAHPKIVGRSPALLKVLRQAARVASADCSVLITGATGTGKELIAQEIHQLSARKARPLVLVNCAALPSELVESELFGRERGAYTGALTSQVGRFEFANGSTIFLDEIGELPQGAQAKLLRVLQEGEFQRLGSPKTHKVDVRVVTATNRDLAEEVRKGKFREDLYYRLRVFPIELPPLSARAEDIPLLVFAFLEEFGTRMGKRITKVRREDMELLQSRSWPGNVRELRNAIEHSMIVSSGDTLTLALLSESPTQNDRASTLAEVEREHILKTLESTRWRIKGPYGAAGRLGLQPSTLYSRMLKLGIPHRRQKDDNSPSSRQGLPELARP